MDKEVLGLIPAGEQKQYFLVDVGAFIIPYLKYNIYTYNRTNITPFIKLLEEYFHITSHVRNYQFHFFIDNGTLQKIQSMYSAYKKNRPHQSRHRREDKIVARDILKSNEYVTNRTLITQFFTLLGEGVYYYSEADYELGYVLKKMVEEYKVDGTQIFVISHDKDLMALIGHSNCIRRLINSKEKYTKYWLFPKGAYDQYLEKDEHVYSYQEFIIRKSLLGDKGDNILAPIMVKESFVKKLFTDYKFKYGYYELDMEKTFEIINEVLIKKIKKKDPNHTKELIEQRLAYEFRRNYLIFDVYNCEDLFMPVDKKFMDIVLQNVITGNIKKNFKDAHGLLQRVSHSHAEIFIKWFNNMKKWYDENGNKKMA